MLTKDRVGAAAVILAAIVGLVLVFSFPQSEGDDDDDARAGQETGQVDQAPGQLAPVPGGDGDGDNDGDNDD